MLHGLAGLRLVPPEEESDGVTPAGLVDRMSAMPDITELALLLRSCTTLGLPEVGLYYIHT